MSLLTNSAPVWWRHRCGSVALIWELIDYFLKPLATCHDSYIKGTYDFLDKVRGTNIPEHALLVTDVTALYTNVDIDRSIQIVKDTFKEFPQPGYPNAEILARMELAFRGNDFEFAGHIFLLHTMRNKKCTS